MELENEFHALFEPCSPSSSQRIKGFAPKRLQVKRGSHDRVSRMKYRAGFIGDRGGRMNEELAKHGEGIDRQYQALLQDRNAYLFRDVHDQDYRLAPFIREAVAARIPFRLPDHYKEYMPVGQGWKRRAFRIPSGQRRVIPVAYGHQLTLNTSCQASTNKVPFLQINDNPCNFSVFSLVRQTVLQDKLKRASLEQSYSSPVSSLEEEEEESSLEEDTSNDESKLKVPKVVGLGLSVVFELLRESRSTCPALCSRGLQALLDTLQGQTPEGLKREPPEVTDALFELLLDLASNASPSSFSSSTQEEDANIIPLLRSFACSCLLSLVVSLGDSGKILKAVSCLLTTPKLSSGEDLETPSILVSMQKSIHAVLLGKKVKPDWMSMGFPLESLCESFAVKEGNSSLSSGKVITFSSKMSSSFKSSTSSCSSLSRSPPTSSCISFDGEHLYLLINNNLLKLGSGYRQTVQGVVNQSRRLLPFHPSHPSSSVSSRGWIGFIKGYLYYNGIGWDKRELMKLDTVSLKEVASVELESSPSCSTFSGPSVAASDGDHLILVTGSQEDDTSFILRTFKPSTLSPQTQSKATYLMPLIQEMTLKLAHKCLLVCGGSSSSVNLFASGPQRCSRSPHESSLEPQKSGSLSPGSPTLVSHHPLLAPSRDTSREFSVGSTIDQQPSSPSNTIRFTDIMPKHSSEESEACFSSLSQNDSPVQVSVGKDFCLVRTLNGRVLFTGKASSLGIKGCHSLPDSGPGVKWLEVPMTRSPRITHVSVGHESSHVLMVADDGSVYFAGTAKRGEDGETSGKSNSSSSRKASRPVKPKRMSRLDGKTVIHSSCNHGTSAVVTKEGELFMFGKDTTHTEGSTGRVTGLRGVSVSQVALGKAHGLVLTTRGYVYSFGLNHKGQCGLGGEGRRPDVDSGKKSHPKKLTPKSSLFVDNTLPSQATAASEPIDSSVEVDITEDVTEPTGCSAGKHKWSTNQCMICSMCGECTGFGSFCVTRDSKEERIPGDVCGCGVGNSGCSECGICINCDKDMREDASRPRQAVLPRGSLVNNRIHLAVLQGGPFRAINFPPAHVRVNVEKHQQDIQRAMNVMGAGRGGARNPRLEPFIPDANQVVRQGSPVVLNPGRNNQMARMEAYVFGNIPDPLFDVFDERQQLQRLDQRVERLDRERRVKVNFYKDVPGRVQGPGVGLKHRKLASAKNEDVFSSQQSLEEGTGSDCEPSVSHLPVSSSRDKLTSLPPTKISSIPCRVSVISSGLHHSVCLTETGEVYTFGSNSQGQLGLGDFINRDKPTRVKIHANVIQIATGSNHTLLLSDRGEVFSFGSNSRGQLGRPTSLDNTINNSLPEMIPSVGPSGGSRATGIDAGGDFSFIRVDESLIHPNNLSGMKAMANSNIVVLIPSSDSVENNNVSQEGPSSQSDSKSLSCLIINRSDGSCNTFYSSSSSSSSTQIFLPNFSSSCLDNLFDVMWAFDSRNSSISRFCITSGQAKSHGKVLGTTSSLMPNYLSPEVTLPRKTGVSISRSNASLNLLSGLDSLTRAHSLGITVTDEESAKTGSQNRVYSKEDYSQVNRFDSHGGGWGYSGHSIEAIRFSTDTDVFLGGIGLFGGRGEYLARVRVYDIGFEGGEEEIDGEIIAETPETSYECGARQKFPLLFDEAIHLIANRWYVAWAMISGPSSDCGSSGQTIVTTDDQVTFFFKSSKKSNNGTDVNAGQIPVLLYRVISSGDLDASGSPVHSRSNSLNRESEDVVILSRDFSMKVSVECFTSLLQLLSWSFKTFLSVAHEVITAPNSCLPLLKTDLKQLTFVSCSCLHLLKVYVNEFFPSGFSRKQSNSFDCMSGASSLAGSVADTMSLMKSILTETFDNIKNNGVLDSFLDQILKEAVVSFSSCYHAFYPSNSLRWRGLCHLLLQNEGGIPGNPVSSEKEKLLSVMMSSLASNPLFVRQLFPLHQHLDLQSLTSPSDIPSPPGFASVARDAMITTESVSCEGLPPGFQSTDANSLVSLLIDKMTERMDTEGCPSGVETSAREVIMKLIFIVKQPIESYLYTNHMKLITSSSASDSSNDNESIRALSEDLVQNTSVFLSIVIQELVCQSFGISPEGSYGQSTNHTLLSTPSRFSRVSPNRTWNTGNGSPEAIAFSVDRSGIFVMGVTLFGGPGNEWHYELELLDSKPTAQGEEDWIDMDPFLLEGKNSSQNWRVIESVRGTYTVNDSDQTGQQDPRTAPVAEVKFERAVAINANVKYAFRLRNNGPRTANGDAGVTSVKGPDGTIFSFSDCSLSFNGTNHSRGQFASILYTTKACKTDPSSVFPRSDSVSRTGIILNQDQQMSRSSVLSVSEAVVVTLVDLLEQSIEDGSYSHSETLHVFSSSSLMSLLMPSICSSLLPLSRSDPKAAVSIALMARKLLPSVSIVNKVFVGDQHPSSLITTSRHTAHLESDHPYKPSGIYHYRVSFPSTVRWMTINFDKRSGTAQSEDSLQIMIPAVSRLQRKKKTDSREEEGVKVSSELDVSPEFLPVFNKFSGDSIKGNWPKKSLVLPGNELILSLETASDYVKDDKSCYFGLKCQVNGFDLPASDKASNGQQGFALLEQEVSLLAVTSVASLLSRSLQLPNDESLNQTIDQKLLMTESFVKHKELLSKGLSLTHIPSVLDALDNILPLSHEKPFLKDFVNCTPGTSGGRLAKWIQPESFVDPSKCSIECHGSSPDESDSDKIICGFPAVITVITRDQYNEVVNVPGLKVEVTAQPFHSHSSSNTLKVVKCHGNEDDEDCQIEQTQVLQKHGNANLAQGVLPSSINIPYSVTTKDKMRYHAISMIPAYESYSFEELRFVAPVKKKSIESMLVRANRDGTFTANWTPAQPGFYQIVVLVDGHAVPSSESLEDSSVGLSSDTIIQVEEAPKGVNTCSSSSVPKGSSGRDFVCREKQSMTMTSNQSSLGNRGGKEFKACRFILRESSGLRIRSLPSLTSAEIGILPPNSIITYTDEVHNEDGVWVRLSHDSLQKYCFSKNIHSSSFPLITEGFALQFNQHYNQILMTPEEVREEEEEETPLVHVLKKSEKSSRRKRRSYQRNLGRHLRHATPILSNGSLSSCPDASHSLSFPCQYRVINTASCGHNIRSGPGTRCPAVGMIIRANPVTATEQIVNDQGTWLKLSEDSKRNYCLPNTVDAWTLASSLNPVTGVEIHYLVPEVTLLADPDEAVEAQDMSYRDSEGVDESDTEDVSADASDEDNEGIEEEKYSPDTESDSDVDVQSPKQEEPENLLHPTQDSVTSLESVTTPVTITPMTASTATTTSGFGSATKSTTTSVTSIISGEGVESLASAAGSKVAAYRKIFSESFAAGVTSLANKAKNTTDLPSLSVSVKEMVRSLSQSSRESSSSPPTTPGSQRKPILRSSSLTSAQVLKKETSQRRRTLSNPLEELLSKKKERSRKHVPLTTEGSPTKGSQAIQRSTTFAFPSPAKSTLASRTSRADSQVICNKRTVGSKKRERLSSPDLTSVKKVVDKKKVNDTDDSSNLSSKKSLRKATASLSSKKHPDHSSSLPVKDAMSNSIAECIRAVFAAFVWHEGILHDAIAAASFLKFNQSLDKDLVSRSKRYQSTMERNFNRFLTQMVSSSPLKRTDLFQTSIASRQQKAKYRHSLDVLRTLKINPESFLNANFIVSSSSGTKREANVPSASLASSNDLSSFPHHEPSKHSSPLIHPKVIREGNEGEISSSMTSVDEKKHEANQSLMSEETTVNDLNEVSGGQDKKTELEQREERVRRRRNEEQSVSGHQLLHPEKEEDREESEDNDNDEDEEVPETLFLLLLIWDEIVKACIIALSSPSMIPSRPLLPTLNVLSRQQSIEPSTQPSTPVQMFNQMAAGIGSTATVFGGEASGIFQHHFENYIHFPGSILSPSSPPNIIHSFMPHRPPLPADNLSSSVERQASDGNSRNTFSQESSQESFDRPNNPCLLVNHQVNMFGEAALMNQAVIRRNNSKSKARVDVMNKQMECELCCFCQEVKGKDSKLLSSSPITHHMRQKHPGCGRPCEGRGYNSVGEFCSGWTGSCGQGGINGIDWYLMCDSCRIKYLIQKDRQEQQERDKKKEGKSLENKRLHLESDTRSNHNKVSHVSSTSALNSLVSCSMSSLEVHQVMKENALFLLKLSSAADYLPSSRSSASSSSPFPSLSSSHVIPCFNNPSGQDFSLPEHSSYFFACLESFGHPFNSSYQQKLAEETLTEDEIRAIQTGRDSLRETFQPNSLQKTPNKNDIHLTGVTCSPRSDKISRFARSVSIGWREEDDESVTQTTASTVSHERQQLSPVPRLRAQSSEQRTSCTSPSHVIHSAARKSKGNTLDQNPSQSSHVSSSLLSHPSSSLRKLLNLYFVHREKELKQDLQTESSVVAQTLNSSFAINTPVMYFVRDQHDISTITSDMKTSVRKVCCRNFSLQAMNWLLRSVTQPTSLHDIFWSFVSSLDPSPVSATLVSQKQPTQAQNKLSKSSSLEEGSVRERIKQRLNGVENEMAAIEALDRDVVAAPDARLVEVKQESSSSQMTKEKGQSLPTPAKKSVEQQQGLDTDSTSLSSSDAALHPVKDLLSAGDGICTILSLSFYSFLESVSNLMPLLPSSSPLQTIAMRCFYLRFHPVDHSFLHRCHVFSNISKILSRVEEDASATSSPTKTLSSLPSSTKIESLVDITALLEIKTSSRQAMMSSLTDRSTETFWESGDEDRNKAKIISVNVTVASLSPRVIYVHIDNSRDPGSKTSQITFKVSETIITAEASSGSNLLKLKSQELDVKFSGWVSCLIPSAIEAKSIRIDLKGPDNTLRVRQLTIMGIDSSSRANVSNNLSCSTASIHQQNCEAETLKVFRLLTSQVFGKLISNVEENVASVRDVSSPRPADSSVSGTESTDLREHMVGILFSRSSRFSLLQKQVCTHIVQAIRVETLRLREEWQSLLCSASSPSAQIFPQLDTSVSSDSYCFEMLSMVLALSGSSIGRSYLSQQEALLSDLFSLLHTASARVQRQVVSLLRRVLPEIKPSSLAKLLHVTTLPNEHPLLSRESENFDPNAIGLLDILLACIAKALTVQTKVKGVSVSIKSQTTQDNKNHPLATSLGGNRAVATVSLATCFHSKDDCVSGDQRWYLKGCMSRKMADMVISLLKDMSNGKISDSWTSVTRNAISEAILNIMKLPKDMRSSPSDCIKCPTLWLSLASLCVLSPEEAERLSSPQILPRKKLSGDQENSSQSQQQTSQTFCANHDDNETLAMVLCASCGNLCSDCDRFLHLHRKTKNHQRQILKEEEEAIKVDLHEGCGRCKLFWIMTLADSKTLKAMVEFRLMSSCNTRDGDSLGSASLLHPLMSSSSPALISSSSLMPMMTGVCRFCGTTGNSGLLAIGNVCSESECQSYSKTACNKMLSCGHLCSGIKDEIDCLPCLHGCGNKDSETGSGLKQDADDMCMICFTEALSAAPSIQLKCKHVFHLHCCQRILEMKWPGPRITFTFSQCPICKIDMYHPVLKELLQPIHVLMEDVKRKAVMRLEYEGLDRNEVVTSPGGRFFNDTAGFAMERYAYYVCCKCKKSYYGGEARCDVEAGGAGLDDEDEEGAAAVVNHDYNDYDPNELVCGGCSDVSRAQMCPKHATDFLEYKCRYCCSVAVYFCFGTTHFCNPCHDDFRRVTSIPKKDLPQCPAGPRARQLDVSDCPLHVQHPPTGEEFALGCGVCRNTHTF